MLTVKKHKAERTDKFQQHFSNNDAIANVENIQLVLVISNIKTINM